ncbi:MAG: L,D-transpeptidase [Pseudonocardia sp.]|nr:L,D-transpeptidase [Pseudonocardia sp.]
MALVLVVVLGFVLFGGGSPGSPSDASSVAGEAATGEAAAGGGAAEANAAAIDPSALQLSSTYTTIDAAPADPDPSGTTEGIVVHPIRSTPVHDGPDGTPIARMATEQFGDTWLPLIGEQDGWVQVLLPSKPAGSTGWIRAADVERAVTPYVVEVHLGSRTLELVRDGETVGEWTVGIGGPETPTPTGRTFLLGAFSDANQDYSPVFLPLGTHSPTLDTFGGGPGTVAIHGWPTDDVFGEATSNGCIRVPQAALDELTEVPLGTLVLVDEA